MAIWDMAMQKTRLAHDLWHISKAILAPKAILVSLLTGILLTACGPTAISPKEEARVGAAQHPKIVAEFGGVYDDQEVTAYVEEVMHKIVAGSGKPGQNYQITVLDSSVVNAFALPGGYTYVTRGLMALANNEAELAGVIGHEIAHVTAYHGTRQQRRAVGTAILASVLDVAMRVSTGVESGVTSDLINLGGAAFLSNFSREQEYEADNLGIRALARAGYEPQAQADLLASLGRYKRYQSGGKAHASSWFDSHPNNKERVASAREEARMQVLEAPGLVGTERYQTVIDGMVFGASTSQGVINQRSFTHTDLRIRFEVPKGFVLENGREQVRAGHDNGIRIIFDTDARKGSGTIAAYLSDKWTADSKLSDLKSFTLGGRKAASAIVRESDGFALLLALEQGADMVLRFAVIVPDKQRANGEAAMGILRRKIRFLTQNAASSVRLLRVKIVTVQKGATIDTMVSHMRAGVPPRALFLTLNGLDETTSLQAGQRVKIVAF